MGEGEPQTRSFIAVYQHPRSTCYRADIGEFRNIIPTYVHGLSIADVKVALSDESHPTPNCEKCGAPYTLKSVQFT